MNTPEPAVPADDFSKQPMSENQNLLVSFCYFTELVSSGETDNINIFRDENSSEHGTHTHTRKLPPNSQRRTRVLHTETGHLLSTAQGNVLC